LDAYAGSGAVGIEALSRGAKHAVLIERNAKALEILRENLRTLEIENEATVVRGSAALLLGNHPSDIAFVDPPYDQVDEYASSLNALAETKVELAIAQHPSKLALTDRYGRLQRVRILRQGENSLSFFE